MVVLAAEAVALLLALTPGVEGDRIIRLGLMSFFVQWVGLMWVGGLCLARRALARYSALRMAWVAGLWLVVVAISVAGNAYALLQGFNLGDPAVFMGHVGLMAAVVAALGLLGFYAFWRAQSWALRARDAELAVLHARIRPHFLFNTLNSIASLIPMRPSEAEEMVESLAGMLRAALAEPGLVSLEQELTLVRAYLSIEAARLEGRLRVMWSGDVLADDAALRRVQVPSLSIQPLVENAVRYGVEPSRSGGDVEIEITHAAESQVRICVRNALLPLPASAAGAGMALSNVRARVEGAFPGRGRLEVTREDGRFVACLVVPG